MRLQGGVRFDSSVISGTSLLFIIFICDINSGITSSSMVSFADDTRLYYGISNVDDDCAILQNDLNSIYESASCSFEFHITDLNKNNKTFNWLDTENFLLLR